MSDVVCARFWAEAFDQARNGCSKPLDGAFGRISQETFEFRECQLNRIEVRAVGRRLEQARAGGFGCLAHAAHFVRTEGVEHHDVAKPEFLDEELLGVGKEGGGMPVPVRDGALREGDVPPCVEIRKSALPALSV